MSTRCTAVMRIGLSSNWREKKGLQKDGLVLTALLESQGHTVYPWQFDDNHAGECCDLIIFLEVINPVFLKWAPRCWLYVNPEWYRPALNYLMPRIELVLCKTQDAVRLMTPIAQQVYYTGFTAEDRFNPKYAQRREFLHVAGGSQAKNTLAVLQAWAQFQLPFQLTVVSRNHTGIIPNVRFVKEASDEDLKAMQNGCLFHIMASEYEGFGMSLHESISTGAVVITGDYPPLNELAACPARLRVPSFTTGQQGVATTHKVAANAILAAVDKCSRMPREEVTECVRNARKCYTEDRAKFEGRFLQLIKHTSSLGRDRLLVSELA